ncbi:MAG: hypothetical protein K0R94_1566 [Burkholderiales bacterium]|jgi:uncharacterized membrane protein YfcA|nr:hypothetical protein [Burkholderiales bacterium]
MSIFLVFFVTLASGLIAVSGGNGIFLMPSLLILGFNIKDVLIMVRISAVVFVFFSFIATHKEKKVPVFNRQDLYITLVSCASIVICVPLLSKLNDAGLMLFISVILVALFLFIIFKPSGQKHKNFFLVFLPIFAGICGSEVGGAGLIITALYTLTGANHLEAASKRLIPSLIIQILAFFMLLMQNLHFHYILLLVVIIATAISGYLNMKIFFNLSSRKSKMIFYGGFLFALGNLLWHAIKEILKDFDHTNWINILKIIFTIH